MKKKEKNILLLGALAVGAFMLLGKRNSSTPQPQCPPGFYWYGGTCVQIQTQTGGNTGGSGGSVWGSFFNSLPGILDSTGNLVNAIQNNPAPASGVGYIYAMRY